MKKYYIGDITIIENFKCETELTHSLLIPSDSFLFGNIFIQDSLMIVGTSRNKEGMISIYNLNTKERLLSICDKGKGNNEYLMQVKRDAPYVCPKTNHLLMNTYNGMLNYIQIDITQSLADGRMVITKNENFERNIPVLWIIILK